MFTTRFELNILEKIGRGGPFRFQINQKLKSFVFNSCPQIMICDLSRFSVSFNVGEMWCGNKGGGADRKKDSEKADRS